METDSYRIIMVFGHARALGNILIRSLANLENTMTIYHKVGEYYLKKKKYIQLTEDINNEEDNLDKRFTELEKIILFATENNKILIIKELPHALADEISLNYLSLLNSKYKIKNIFLARNPKATYNSMNKVLNYTDAPTELKKDRILQRSYESLMNLYDLIKGLVVITEDLQADPEKKLREICNFLDIEYNDCLVKFKPFDIDSIPEIWHKLGLEWFEQVINSTEFKVSNTNIDSIIINDEFLQERIDNALPYYNYFIGINKEQI